MKKPISFIFKKRQLVLALLVACLGGAIYLNYVFETGDGNYELSSMEVSKNYGESQWVDSPAEDVPLDMEYFEEAKLNRESTRDEAVQTLKTMLGDSELSVEQQESLTEDARAMAKAIETEGKIENLVKAKGFSQCMAYFDGESVSVVVKSEGLKKEQVAQIKDIVIENSGVPAENISIVEVE